MTRLFAASALTGFLLAGVSKADELLPGSGHSIQLATVNGVVYYTVEQDGYRVVATLASGPEAQPIRFVSTLGPGESVTLSVPQAAGQPSIDLEIRRNGETLLLTDTSSASTASPLEQEHVNAALGQ